MGVASARPRPLFTPLFLAWLLVAAAAPRDNDCGGKMAAAAAAAWLWRWLWNERFWLPANVSWADLEREGPGDGSFYPRPDHLLVVFPLAVGLFLLRRLFERFIAKPCAMYFGIQDNGPRRARPNAILEKVFTSITKCPDARRLAGLSKQLDWDVQKIQRWFRHRRNQEKPTIFAKFCESLGRLTFYLTALIYGLSIVWSSPWLSDTKNCWYGYPYQLVTLQMYNYYIMELTFYWCLLFSQFIDIKRKDFLVMFIHHLAAISLLSLSYTLNMVRVGALVLCLHDMPDIFLEVAKMANYAKYQRLCDATFILFSVLFIVTRLGLYPFWLLNTTLFESWEIIGPYQSWWIFNGMLLLIQILHVFWSYFIIRTAYKALVRGKVLPVESFKKVPMSYFVELKELVSLGNHFHWTLVKENKPSMMYSAKLAYAFSSGNLVREGLSSVLPFFLTPFLCTRLKLDLFHFL
ncbi:ceramide synthase 5 isoform X2 [Tiliqua scincoides]